MRENLNEMIDLIVYILYAWPVGTLRDEEIEPVDKLLPVVLAFVLYALLAAIVLPIVFKLFRHCWWLLRRTRCQHQQCRRWTMRRSDGSHDGCLAGEGCCEQCVEWHLDLVARERGAAMTTLTCGSCISSMTKIEVNRIIFDVCDECGTISLRRSEQGYATVVASRIVYAAGSPLDTISPTTPAMPFVITAKPLLN